jgi:hypothetical protein
VCSSDLDHDHCALVIPGSQLLGDP